MSLIFESALAHSLKKTLNKIIDDPSNGADSLVMKTWLDIGTMDEAFIDDLEMAGSGLITEKPEGQEMGVGTIKEGPITRYLARTFGQRLMITEEAMEDGKYPEAIKLGKRLNRATYKTADIDATNMLVRGWNSSYTGGDGVCLFNTAHPLVQGGTFSNTLSTPMSPSRAAVIIVTAAMRKLPGHDGVIEGVEPIAALFPTEQWAVWDELIGSEKAPEPGEYNAINVVERLKLKAVGIKYWTNTSTNWALKSDCEDGLRFLWRRKPRSKTWVNNDQEVMIHGMTARWARGWSDPRCAYGSQA